MSSKTSLLERQRAWAAASGLTPDARGYLPSYEENLFQALSTTAHAAFTHGSGSELVPAGIRPAKMAALHSSSALAVNAFDYWSTRSLGAVADALGIDPDPTSFVFEAQFPTGLAGTPPNLDLAFRYADGRILGIESKFTEWLTPKPARKEHFKPKYFPDGSNLWSQVGLPAAQRIAKSLHRQEQTFRHLDAAQLLKHMLGLATAAPSQCRLYYLFFDWPGPESSIHRVEIEQFAKQLGSEMQFRWSTYQQLISRLQDKLHPEHEQYVEYLARRYGPNAA